MKRIRSPLPKIALIILAVSLLVLPACSNDKTPDSSPNDSYTIADATGDWGYPSPYLRYSRGPGYTRMSFIFETLVWKDAAGFVPQLAEEWEYNEAENAYLFKLRDDVTWHDGEKFTAGDVVFTVEYIKKHPDPFITLIGPSGIKEAVALDDYTVKLYLEQSYAPFLNDIAGTMVIFPEHIWQGVADPKSLTGPEAVIGTGPYTLADYSQEHGTYLYRAYGGYYLGEPAVKEIKFVKISAEMIPAALKDGSVSAGDIPPEIVAEMEAAGFNVITAPVAWNAKLTINHGKEPLSDKRFRQALAYGIDREALVQITQRGHATAGSPGMVPPTSGWYNPDTSQYEYSPEKARELLEEMGYGLEGGYFAKDGRQLELELLASAAFKDVGKFIKQQLEQLGIKVDFQTLEAKTVDAKVAAWDFDLSVYGHGGLYEPSILKRVITDDGFNSARYTSSEELNRLLEAQLHEMNPDKRKALVYRIQELYAADLPALTLYYPKSYWAHDGKVNLYYTRDGIASGVPIPLNRMSFVKQEPGH
ncbi:ABC transporter substrate-binding protein [Chloroflexota bacterium]